MPIFGIVLPGQFVRVPPIGVYSVSRISANGSLMVAGWGALRRSAPVGGWADGLR